MKKETKRLFFTLLLLSIVCSLWGCHDSVNAKRYKDSFLADNWDMSIDDWEGWSVSYQSGKGYFICQIDNRDGQKEPQTSRILVIMNPDSVCFKTDALSEYGVFSIRTSPKEREWRKAFPELSKEELLSKASLLVQYPIERIQQYPDSALYVVLSTGHKDALVHLMKAVKKPSDERWMHIGGDWYEMIIR